MGNEISYHKERAQWHSTFREDKWGSTHHADERKEHHLRQIKRLEEKKRERAQKKASEREKELASKRADEQRRIDYRRREIQRQEVEFHRQREAIANQQKEDLMVSMIATYNKGNDECEKWKASIFSHLSPGGDEMERLVLRTRDNHLDYSMGALRSVSATVDAWASERYQEIAKVEIVNRAVREWNLFIERLDQVGGRTSLPQNHAKQVDTCESIVDDLIKNGPSFSHEKVVSLGCRIKELLDGVYSEMNKRKALLDGMKLLVLDDATQKKQTLHHHITCDKCSECPIHGKRYKCAECANYDMCEHCYKNDSDHSRHLFLKIAREGSDPVALLHKSGPYGDPNPAPQVLESLQRLYALSVKNNVDFRELFDYSMSEDTD